jgi:hypothetical protein
LNNCIQPSLLIPDDIYSHPRERLTTDEFGIENITVMTAFPTEWFELEYVKNHEEILVERGWRAKLFSALMPKKNTGAEDSRYNTTIGMLTMF